VNPIIDIIDAYLNHFPLYPGCRFFEANTEYSTFQIHGDEKDQIKKSIESRSHIKCYATLSIGISNKNNCRLIMEDSGYLKKGEERDLTRLCVKSILAIEKVEHYLNVAITYDKVFLLTTFSDELRVDKNRTFSKGNDFIPVWSQSQFIYANPPKEICPARLSIHDLKEISFEEWKKSIKDNSTLKNK
jgi:hypothetical protein